MMDKLLAMDVESTGKGATLQMTKEEIKQAIANDIESLLNTRQSFEMSAITAFPHAARSLLTYGMTDISSLCLASDRDRARVTESIRRLLSEHEQRLTHVEVTVQPRVKVGEGLRFSIRARLNSSLAMEAVAFDAVLDSGSLRYAVSRCCPEHLLRTARFDRAARD